MTYSYLKGLLRYLCGDVGRKRENIDEGIPTEIRSRHSLNAVSRALLLSDISVVFVHVSKAGTMSFHLTRVIFI